jgi:hypothetical protein
VVFAAAVLVHPIADVRRWRSHLDRFTTGSSRRHKLDRPRSSARDSSQYR